jgi:hypothetical protein
MSPNPTYDASASTANYRKPSSKRPAPFSIRLSADERRRLTDDAGSYPLGAYIRDRLLSDGKPARVRRSGASLEDREAFAQALALLGASRLSSNVNQLARLANSGSLPLSPETFAELSAAVADIREIRRLLIEAVGLQPEAAQ